MNKRSVAQWGFVGTVVLTSLLSGSQGLGLTRMNLPFMLGTIFTPNRDRAKLVGFGVHFLNGWLFASIYAAAFESWRCASWWLGAAIGVVHALFVLVAAMPILPGMHPRMASEQYGPTSTKQLEPPGFLALNYGWRTPISVLVAHIVYGGILGAFYRVKKIAGPPCEWAELSRPSRFRPEKGPSSTSRAKRSPCTERMRNALATKRD